VSFVRLDLVKAFEKKIILPLFYVYILNFSFVDFFVLLGIVMKNDNTTNTFNTIHNKCESSEFSCQKVEVELCAPEHCKLVQESPVCREEIKTVITEVPTEDCSLSPHKTCQFITKLVPSLEASEECIDVPYQTCSRVRSRGRKVKVPLLKKWCIKAPNR